MIKSFPGGDHEKTMERKQENSDMKNGIVMSNPGEKGNFCWPSVARLANGRLAVVASGFRLDHVCPFGCVAASFSLDEGETWSEPSVVFDTPLDDRDAGITPWKDGKVILTTFNNTRLFQRRQAELYQPDQAKKIIFSYLSGVSDETEKKYFGSLWLEADDDLRVTDWGKLPLSSPHGMTVLNDGTLFYVGRKFGHPDVTGEADPVDEKIGYVTGSDPRKMSGFREILLPSGEAEKGVLFCEPHALQLRSGRILVHIRAQKEGLFTVYGCHSDDGGKTFTLPERLRVPEGEFRGSPPHLFETSRGEVVLTYGYREAPFGQRARISRDDGESWSREIVLRDDGKNWDLGYPATAECPDGSLITVYYQSLPGEKNRSILYTKWRVEEVL